MSEEEDLIFFLFQADNYVVRENYCAQTQLLSLCLVEAQKNQAEIISVQVVRTRRIMNTEL